jgi:hypothetical protein
MDRQKLEAPPGIEPGMEVLQFGESVWRFRNSLANSSNQVVPTGAE